MLKEGHSLPFYFFLPWRNTPSGSGPPYYRGLMITIRLTTLGRTPGRVISPTQRPLPDNTQQSRKTDIHAPGAIRTHNPSKRAATETDTFLLHLLYFMLTSEILCRWGLGSTGSLRRVAGCKFQTIRGGDSLSSRVKCSHKEISSFTPEDDGGMLVGNKFILRKCPYSYQNKRDVRQ
jgi:hypothetical protein